MKNLKKFEQFTLNNEQTNKVMGGSKVSTVLSFNSIDFANLTPINTVMVLQDVIQEDIWCFPES